MLYSVAAAGRGNNRKTFGTEIFMSLHSLPTKDGLTIAPTPALVTIYLDALTLAGTPARLLLTSSKIT
jgi:hypothetical protein